MEIIVINLAIWNYKSILQSKGGPIRRISYKRVLENDKYYPNGFESFAYLADCLKINTNENFELYGNADGAGFSKNLQESNNKAISEAIERWAFYATFNNQKTYGIYGYNISPTTSGMAAFPEPLPYHSKRNAFYEAVERLSITEWWVGNLAVEQIKNHLFNQDLDVFRIYPISKNTETVLIHKKNEVKGFHVYAFASHKNIETAVKKALIELRRNESVLTSFFLKPNFTNPIHIYEQRLVYFADKGFEEFESRIKNTLSLKSGFLKNYRLLVNTEIQGPWSKYAKVWRSVFDESQTLLNLDNPNFFMF
jgi:hypothetical protein